MIDVGAVGSPVDVATFVMVLGLLVYEVRPKQEVLSAAVVALAKEVRSVDEDRLKAELGVADRQVEQLEPTIVRVDGGQDDG